MDHAAALALVLGALDAANELRPLNDQIERSPDVRLTGDGGKLDSLGLATMLMAIETRVEDTTGETIELLDEAAADPDGTLGAFETPDRLAALIVSKLAA
jgi:acyl carrier protein